jgi:hypothetical protein
MFESRFHFEFPPKNFRLLTMRSYQIGNGKNRMTMINSLMTLETAYLRSQNHQMVMFK